MHRSAPGIRGNYIKLKLSWVIGRGLAGGPFISSIAIVNDLDNSN